MGVDAWRGEECKDCSVRYGPSLTCIGGEGQNIRKAMEELEKIGVGLSQAKQCKVLYGV